jgi:Ferredoxin-dependent bilin reductase
MSFAEVLARTERRLVSAFGLEPLALAPELADRSGTWKGGPALIAARGYAGGPLRYARFVELEAEAMSIVNVLCLPALDRPLPIFGADLVGLGSGAMVAADLSPVAGDFDLRPLARRLAAHPPLPSGGVLPDWCARWFSPYALYTRVPAERAAEAAERLLDFADAFVEIAAAPHSTGDPIAVRSAQDGYCASHRKDDRGLNLLRALFGAAWAERFVAEILFPVG